MTKTRAGFATAQGCCKIRFFQHDFFMNKVLTMLSDLITILYLLHLYDCNYIWPSCVACKPNSAFIFPQLSKGDDIKQGCFIDNKPVSRVSKYFGKLRNAMSNHSKF